MPNLFVSIKTNAMNFRSLFLVLTLVVIAACSSSESGTEVVSQALEVESIQLIAEKECPKPPGCPEDEMVDFDIPVPVVAKK